MAKPIPENIKRLQDEYAASQARLIKIIEQKEARGNSTVYRKRLMGSVNQELKILTDFSTKWAKGEITDAYNQGINKVLSDFRSANIDVSKVAANNTTLKTIINNTVGDLSDANRYIGRTIEDNIRQAGLEATAQGLGNTVKETKKILLDKLTAQGITAIKDKRGRPIKADAYASMVARTTTREATNTALIDAVESAGHDLVKITSHFSTCPICAVYEGRVYSISGKTKGYPKLDVAFSGGHMTIHPNCTHSAIFYTPKFDDDPAKTKEESNRPYKVSQDQQRSVDNYNKEQAIKTQRRNDRNEWEEAKAVDPAGAPKTFSGYRAAKRADNDKYKDLRDKVNEAKKNAPIEIDYMESLKKKGVIVATDTFQGLDKELIDANIKRLDSLLGKYPFVNKDFPLAFDARELKGGAMAEAGGMINISRLSINTTDYKNAAQLKEKLLKDLKSGWLVNVSDDALTTSTIDHEFGHLIHNAIIRQKKLENPSYYAELTKKAYEKKTNEAIKLATQKINTDILKEINLDILTKARIAGNGGTKYTDLKSNYGMSKPQEWFAEAFSNSVGGEQNVIGKAMEAYLRGLK
jgi:hypothetical protein